MPACSIKWCGKNSKTSNCKKDGITFHRYPKNPKLKEKWINATKRENWFPTLFSVICSRHFTQDCFYQMKNRRRLLNSAVPTLFLPQLADKSALLTLMPAVLVKDERPVTLFPSLESHNDTDSNQIPATTQCETSQHKLSPVKFTAVKKKLGRRIIELSSHIKEKNRQIKNLKQKVAYVSKRVTSLKKMIKELKMACRCKVSEDYSILC